MDQCVNSKDTEEAAIAKEQALLDRSPEAARESLYQTFLSQGDCETEAEVKVNQAFSKNPIKVLVEEKYGVDMEEITNPCMLPYLVFCPFQWDLCLQR